MAAGDAVVQGVDALEDGNLVFPQGQGAAQAVVAHLPGKLKLGHQHLLPPGQGGKVPVQQIHVQAQGGLKVQAPLGGAGGSGVQGFEIVIQGHRMAVHAPPPELLRDFHGSGGLP